MYKKIFFLLLIIFSQLCNAQESTKKNLSADTVKLKELTVTVNIPLTNKNVVDFYRTNQFSTLDNINARLDGMSLIKRGAYALEPQMNGFSGGQLNVTIDGMKMFGACTDKMDPITSYIEPSNLKAIKLKSGTNCSENGCNIGGSVDMTLQEPNVADEQRHFSSVAFGYESISKSRNVLFSVGTGIGKWAWMADGVYRKTENYTAGNGQIVPFSQFEKTNLHTALKYNPDKVNSFKADVLYDIARNVGYPALPMDVSTAKASLFALEYSRKAIVQLKAKLYYNRVIHIMDDSQRDSLYLLKAKPVGKSDSVYMRMDMPGRSSTLGAYVQLIIPWNERNRLTLKADNYTNNSIAEMTMHMRYAGFAPEPAMYMQTWPAMLRNVSGVYVENSTYLSPKLSVTANARVDYTIDHLQSQYGQDQFSVFNYSLGKVQRKLIKSFNLQAQYQIANDMTITATAGHSERMPTIGERLGFYLFNAYDGYDYIGNPYIKTEKSNFLKFAFQLSKSVIKLNVSPSVSFLSDYIMGLTDADIAPMNFYAKGIRVYSNVPKAKLLSMDMQLLYTPLPHYSVFWLSKFTYGEINGGEAMPLIPPLKNVVAFQYQNNEFQLQAECESALSQHRINSSYGEQTTPAYSVFNVKSSYGFLLSKVALHFSAGVTNLFNKVYYEHLDWGRIYRPGRSLELYLKVSY
ncbi:MAG: TonB-dependent receptor [Paludibacter sp.]|nr:TonB-dependent receptor [Paludibacter sp.]